MCVYFDILFSSISLRQSYRWLCRYKKPFIRTLLLYSQGYCSQGQNILTLLFKVIELTAKGYSCTTRTYVFIQVQLASQTASITKSGKKDWLYYMAIIDTLTQGAIILYLPIFTCLFGLFRFLKYARNQTLPAYVHRYTATTHINTKEN